VSGRWAVLVFVGLFVAYCGFAAWLPLLDDEAYYWCWAQTPQLSYFDHAPMSGYFIWLSTHLFGDSPFAIRFPAVLSSMVVVFVVWRMMRPSALWKWVLFTPLYTLGAVVITPDTPFLLFWALYMAWLVKVHRRLTPEVGQVAKPLTTSWWCLGGVLLGLGALGKYTMALAVPATFLSFLLVSPRRWREWLPGYVGHGVISFVLFLPVIVFNWQHDFVPIGFQWEHANSVEPGQGGVKSLGEFVAIQIALFGLLPLVLLPWVWGRFRTLSQDPLLRVGACFYALPFTFFLYKAWKGPLEGNWALAAYTGFWPIAAYWYDTICPARWRVPVRMVTFGAPFMVAIGVAVHLVSPISLFSVRADRISRQTPRLEAVRLGVEAAKRDGLPIPIYTPTYQMTALLRYYGGDACQMEGVSRPSHFTMKPTVFEDVEEAYIWNESALPLELANSFAEPRLVASFEVVVRGEVVSGYHLMHYRKLKPGEVRPAEYPEGHQLREGSSWFQKWNERERPQKPIPEVE
jgi:4-amino-4-deoxy-L-arabinose transferase-like glycosyltransferase